MDTDIDRIYREDSGRILATLIRLLGSFDLAEEVLQEAFTAALERWPKDGMPSNPRAWLVSTAQHKGIDLLRRSARFESKREELQKIAELEQQLAGTDDTMLRHGPNSGDHSNGARLSNNRRNNDQQNADLFDDDRLRLIFTCCHPALALEAQVALTLRTLCGLTTEQIARAFLVPVPTLAQRLVRAKQKIRDARIPYQIPPPQELATRLEAVMLVVYLVFNEGYSANSGASVIRRELCSEAIRLARLISELLPRHTESRALLALMLLHDSRSPARVHDDGEIVLLEEQNRNLWNRDEIAEGLVLVESALREAAPGPYALQAAIAAVHARAQHPEETDWRQIAGLYEVLLRVQPSPIIELNRAAAIAMSEGPAAGLHLLDALESKAELRDYYLLSAARGDLLRRLQQWPAATIAYRRALSLATNEAERRFLSRRLAEAESMSQ